MFFEKKPLELGTRKKVYSLIERAPGLHFRELQRRTKFAVGALQYQLDVLEKNHLVKKIKKGKFARYYSVRKPVGEESQGMIHLLRQNVPRQIALFILSRKRAPSGSAIGSAIGLSPSTATFHLNKLEEEGLITKRKSGKKTLIYLKEPQKIAGLLSQYRKSFLDEMVDNFVEAWDEIAQD